MIEPAGTPPELPKNARYREEMPSGYRTLQNLLPGTARAPQRLAHSTDQYNFQIPFVVKKKEPKV
jgi:hypothetical protein